MGSGETGKTNVGGPSSSFGIWHELKSNVKAIAEKYGLKIKRIHTHIGSTDAIGQLAELVSNVL